MLTEIVNQLCIRPDVVAFRFPGEMLNGESIAWDKNNELVPTILQHSQLRGVRYVVLDTRNFISYHPSFAGTCIDLNKCLREAGCRLILVCGIDFHEVMVITKLNRLFPVLLNESDLQQFLDSDKADVPLS